MTLLNTFLSCIRAQIHFRFHFCKYIKKSRALNRQRVLKAHRARKNAIKSPRPTMQLNPPSEHETASDKKEKYLLFFAPTSTSKNVSTVAFDISKEKEKEIAEKLSSMCTTDSPILPIDCAP